MTTGTTTAPLRLVIFGASSLVGEALLEQLPAATEVCCLSRHRPPGQPDGNWRPCDLTDLTPSGLLAAAASLPSGPPVWLALAHIWLMAPFLSALRAQHPDALRDLRGVVACSSSSVITKRFAANPFDRSLVARLDTAQEQLCQDCAGLGVPARILAPTLIHGRTAHHRDRNVESLRGLLRRLPLLPLPQPSGLRQPIAAADLAAVILDQARRIAEGPLQSAMLPLGGDESLTYRAMLERIQSGDRRACRCRLLPLPTRLFQLLTAPVLLLSPKGYEALLRLSANLSGFERVADLLEREPLPFSPFQPSGSES
ncbi:MAG: hypothetical protein NTW83_03295 [Cyanobacteria bacterium]|nr:hypothetical protein [Cyanobacteriota bacterium]